MNRSVAVIGGSLTGLAASILLRRAGWHADVYERSAERLSDRGAGIVMQPETLELLRLCGAKSNEEVGVMLHTRQYLAEDGAVLSSQRMPQLMTSWGLLYSWLRQSFPDEHYHLGRACERVVQNGSAVTAEFTDGTEASADLLVAADGFRSTVRGFFLPEVTPTYAGYVAWRGVVAESEVAEEVLNVFTDSFTFFQMAGSHCLCYLIPGEDGSTSKGHRRLNWVWYWNVAEADLPKLLTDANGKRRAYAIPPGSIHPDEERKQREIADRLLPQTFRSLLQATREPFVQAIMDLGCPQLVFDRVVLCGDASFVVRPHTAASTSKGVGNAFALALELTDNSRDFAGALQNWERAELHRGRQLLSHGQGLGRSQSR
ncbi:MAG TPA: FAD binding domain-containing protein [Bryobacteraceae bacterium]|nr:FAD binding domain-containing protein [Bryobacteraceae bacterium]